MAVPSEPGKRPKAPATGLPGKGDDAMSEYMKSNMGATRNQGGGRHIYVWGGAACGWVGLSRKRAG